MREVTEQGECCALIDASNAFDPLSASANGVNLDRLFWARCAAPHAKLSPVDKSLKATDMILSAGGFGLIVLDLGDIEPRLTQKIPLSYWYRFRRAVELTAAAFIVLEQQPSAKSCASLVIALQMNSSEWVPTRSQAQNPKLLTGANFSADVIRSRIATSPCKPPPTNTEFRVATSWAG
jgi:recombination protein RecA